MQRPLADAVPIRKTRLRRHEDTAKLFLRNKLGSPKKPFCELAKLTGNTGRL